MSEYVDGVMVRWQPWLRGVVGVLDYDAWERVFPDGRLESEIQDALNEGNDEVGISGFSGDPMWHDFDAAQAFVDSSRRREHGAFALERCLNKVYVSNAKRR